MEAHLRAQRLLGREKGALRRRGEAKLVSKAAAARELGIDLKTTLAELIAQKKIRTVPGPKGPRIPRSEIERLVSEGIPAVSANGKKARSKSASRLAGGSSSELAKSILSIPIGDE
jgi:hypothetical protein